MWRHRDVGSWARPAVFTRVGSMGAPDSVKTEAGSSSVTPRGRFATASLMVFLRRTRLHERKTSLSPIVAVSEGGAIAMCGRSCKTRRYSDGCMLLRRAGTADMRDQRKRDVSVTQYSGPESTRHRGRPQHSHGLILHLSGHLNATGLLQNKTTYATGPCLTRSYPKYSQSSGVHVQNEAGKCDQVFEGSHRSCRRHGRKFYHTRRRLFSPIKTSFQSYTSNRSFCAQTLAVCHGGVEATHHTRRMA